MNKGILDLMKNFVALLVFGCAGYTWLLVAPNLM